MNKKTVSTYFVGVIAGLGLAMSSVAFAMNTGDSNKHSMGQSNQTNMHEQKVKMNTHGSNTMGHTSQTAMHNQVVKKNFRGNMHGGTTTHHAQATNQ